jgi:hypothetical protein
MHALTCTYSHCKVITICCLRVQGACVLLGSRFAARSVSTANQLHQRNVVRGKLPAFNESRTGNVIHNLHTNEIHYIFTLYSLLFNPYICFGLYKAIFRGLINYIHFTSNFLSAITFSPVSSSYILQLFTMSVFKILQKHSKNSKNKKKTEKILEIERGSTRSHHVENLLWKRLRTCRKTDYRINE